MRKRDNALGKNLGKSARRSPPQNIMAQNGFERDY